MIKTIVEPTLEDLDREVNAFLREKKINAPVRTETYVIDGEPYHKATVFYDENFGSTTQAANPDLSKLDKNTYENKGALWIQEDGSYKGKWNDETISISENLIAQLEQNGKVELNLKGVDSIIIPNQFKKTEKHPDFVILPKKN